MKWVWIIVKGVFKCVVLFVPILVICLLVVVISIGGGDADPVLRFIDKLIDW